jgi:Asp/Glu/hydantoin racemase
MGAIVLECTDLPPYAKRISEATGLPVFDFVSMMGHVAIALGEIDLY